ncbi:MAG: PilZ domain-containing protein [Candidatus Aminicenantales bacterium]
MAYKGVEIRSCRRFHVLGATVNYALKKRPFLKRKFHEEECPVLDISRGGIRFVCDNLLKINRKIFIELHFSDESEPLPLKGSVVWLSVYPGKSYRYQTGIQFAPFGERKGLNSAYALKKIVELEKRILPSD